MPSCAGLCARSLRCPRFLAVGRPPPSDVPPRESTVLCRRGLLGGREAIVCVLCARLMRTMRPAPASRGWLWRGPSPLRGNDSSATLLATFLRRSEASAPTFLGVPRHRLSLASFLGSSDMERERLPLPDFSEGPPSPPARHPVHGACVRGSRASGGSKGSRGAADLQRSPGPERRRARVRSRWVDISPGRLAPRSDARARCADRGAAPIVVVADEQASRHVSTIAGISS